jgi:hypothetical protein
MPREAKNRLRGLQVIALMTNALPVSRPAVVARAAVHEHRPGEELVAGGADRAGGDMDGQTRDGQSVGGT